MREMEDKKILYGGSLSYRHMCRFNSGFFYRLEIMQKYDFYWRIEPCIHFPLLVSNALVTEYYCDLYYDPFKFMRENNKKYGWVMALYEFGMSLSCRIVLILPAETIPTLWQTVREFAANNPSYIAKENAAHFMVDDPTKGLDGNYNLCHVLPLAMCPTNFLVLVEF